MHLKDYDQLRNIIKTSHIKSLVVVKVGNNSDQIFVQGVNFAIGSFHIQSIINILQNGAYMEQNTTQKVDIPHTNTDYKSNSY